MNFNIDDFLATPNHQQPPVEYDQDYAAICHSILQSLAPAIPLAEPLPLNISRLTGHSPRHNPAKDIDIEFCTPKLQLNFPATHRGYSPARAKIYSDVLRFNTPTNEQPQEHSESLPAGLSIFEMPELSWAGVSSETLWPDVDDAAQCRSEALETPAARGCELGVIRSQVAKDRKTRNKESAKRSRDAFRREVVDLREKKARVSEENRLLQAFLSSLSR